MRLTTKIILGIIGGIFAISLLFIIGFSFTERGRFKPLSFDTPPIEYPLGGATNIEIDAFKVVCINYEQPDADNRSYVPATLTIEPIPEGESEQKLMVSEKMKDYMEVYTVNDTLMITLGLDRLLKEFQASDTVKILRQMTVLSGALLHLQTQFVDVVNNASSVDVKIANIKADLIKINSMNIRIDSCEATSVSPFGKGSFMIRNSTVHSLNVDLDNIGSWTVENCNIQEENLTGSNQHSVLISKKEAKALNWLPKNKDARLHTEIQGGESVKLIFE